MKLKVFLLISQGFFTQKIGDKCEENISGYHLKWERIQACSISLVHDNLVVFWIFIQFQLRQSNHVQYRNLQVSNRVNLSACA